MTLKFKTKLETHCLNGFNEVTEVTQQFRVQNPSLECYSKFIVNKVSRL